MPITYLCFMVQYVRSTVLSILRYEHALCELCTHYFESVYL